MVIAEVTIVIITVTTIKIIITIIIIIIIITIIIMGSNYVYCFPFFSFCQKMLFYPAYVGPQLFSNNW